MHATSAASDALTAVAGAFSGAVPELARAAGSLALMGASFAAQSAATFSGAPGAEQAAQAADARTALMRSLTVIAAMLANVNRALFVVNALSIDLSEVPVCSAGESFAAHAPGSSVAAGVVPVAAPAKMRPEQPRAVARGPAFRWAAGERDRLALLPIRHEDIWEQREKLKGLHWNAQEVVLGQDKKDWVSRMTAPQQHFVSMQLAFFSRVDIDALEYIDGLSAEVDCMEAKMYYASQAEQECTHAEGYSLQITAITDGAERDALLNAAKKMPIVGRIRDWVRRWFDPAIPIEERLVAFAGVEGVLFSASFCALQWLREKNLLPGITAFNDFIARDEGVHADTTALLVRKYLWTKPSEQVAHGIFHELVSAIIDPFVRESLPVQLLGINADLMMQYVRYQADCVTADMGYAPLYRVENPFSFMHKLALNDVSKGNFFEKRVTAYQNVTKSGAGALELDTSSADD
jgi:ribonucleotide reductase beta subunit family protein with ferritin-like domain